MYNLTWKLLLKSWLVTKHIHSTNLNLQQLHNACYKRGGKLYQCYQWTIAVSNIVTIPLINYQSLKLKSTIIIHNHYYCIFLLHFFFRFILRYEILLILLMVNVNQIKS